MQIAEEKSSSSSNKNGDNTTSARRRRNKLFLDGQNHTIQELCKLLENVGATTANVFVLGESGTSKELVSRAIHALSNRSTEPFISINCAEIAPELHESHLFGLEKGSFPSANEFGKGCLELANNGTLFIDEIGAINDKVQAKLLRVMQDGEFEKVGGASPISVNVRVISASPKNLEQLVKKEKFNADLFTYLNAFPIEMPPLRRSAEDIPALICAITEKIQQERGASYTITNDAIKVLSSYSWPGNVKELSNLIERLSILYPPNSSVDGAGPQAMQTITENSHEDMLESDTTEKDQNIPAGAYGHLPESGFNLKNHIAELEVHYIREALESTNGVVAQAAKLLGLRRTTLVEKLRKYGIQR